nr:hypothetical protein [Tanacetum cinerariifolium]
MNYLNITKKNVVKVFHKEFIPGNGSGLGGSGMLMKKEEIVKLVEEEEMVDLELHVYRNVIDQKNLYKFDEEALDLVLEEEARESRAHKECGLGGSGMLMKKEEIVKLVEEEEMVDLELHVYRNVIDQKNLYKFDEEALDLVLEEEARESRAHKECVNSANAVGGGVLEALGANKAITHPVIAIFLYPLRAVEAAFALEVDAMGALDLVEVEAV